MTARGVEARVIVRIARPSAGRRQSKSFPSAVVLGGFKPKCRQVVCVAIRPREVRCK